VTCLKKQGFQLRPLLQSYLARVAVETLLISQVLNSYGPNTNSKLLLDYGFATLGNRFERIRLSSLTLDCDDPLCARKRALLRRLEISAFAPLTLAADVYPREALRFLSVACADVGALALMETSLRPALVACANTASALSETQATTAPSLTDELQAIFLLLKKLRSLESQVARPDDNLDLHAKYSNDLSQSSSIMEESHERRLFALTHRVTRKLILTSNIVLLEDELAREKKSNGALVEKAQRAAEAFLSSPANYFTPDTVTTR
jgi:hypothetical protein